MRLTRKVSLVRSFHLAIVTIVSLFIVANIANITTTAAAPTIVNQVVAPAVDYIPADVPSSGDHNLDLIILHAAEQYGVDPRLLHAVIWQESRYNVNARSGRGAEGLMQLIPATAKRFDCADANDPQSNVTAGAKYLRWLLERFNGDVALALAGYNAGEGSVDKYNGVPPYGETQNYVRSIIARYGQTYHPLLTPDQALIQFHLTQELAAN